MGWTSSGLPGKRYYKPNVSDSEYGHLKKYYIQFQVDTDYSNPTSVSCRAKFGHDSWSNGSGSDYFYLYFPDIDGNGKEASFLLHNGDTKVLPDYTSSFTLEKNWNDDYFTLPQCYIFNQGRQSIGSFDKSLFDGSRKNWKFEIPKDTSFYDGWTPMSISPPTLISIVDNGNNTATISGTAPGTATPNVTYIYPYPNNVSSTLWYTTDSRYEPNVSGDNRRGISLDPGSFNKVVYRIDNSDTNITQFEVDAWVDSDPTYGDNKTASIIGVGIKYWKAPGTQPIPSIQPIMNGKNLSKVTPKCTLRCQWDMAPVGNSNSSALNHNGCRFYFSIKREGTDIWETYGDNIGENGRRYIDIYYEDKTTPLNTDHNSPGFVCYKVSGSNSFYVDIDSETYDLQKGDKIQIGIQPWTTNITRDGSRRWWAGVNSYSVESVVESAGIVNIKQSANSWIEGQVYIKTTDGWLEADSVYIKDSSGWKESI